MKKRNDMYVMTKAQWDKVNERFRKEIQPRYACDSEYGRGMYDGYCCALQALGFVLKKVDGVDTIKPKLGHGGGAAYRFLEFYRSELASKVAVNKMHIELNSDGGRALDENDRKRISEANKYLRQAVKDIDTFLDERGIWND